MNSLTNQLAISKFNNKSLNTNELAGWLIVLLAFFIPISTALVNICVFSIIGLWLLTRDIRNKFFWYLSYPLTKPILFFAFVYLIGITYTSADLEHIFFSMRDIMRICVIPILAYYLHKKNPSKTNLVLYAFVTAILFNLIFVFLKNYAQLSIGEKYGQSCAFKDHIVTSFFIATTIYYIFIQYYYDKTHQIFFPSLILVLLYDLFYINTGRTGFIILFTSFFVFTFDKFRLKGLGTLVLLFTFLLIITYFTSEVFATRINELHLELMSYIDGKTISSIGTRLEFAVNSFLLFLKQPLFGFGTGSFYDVYARAYEGQVVILTDNPHNEYLRIMVEFGSIGLFAFVWLLVCIWHKAIKLSNPSKRIFALGVFFSFFVGCFFNSWINDFTECYFFCLMIVCLLPPKDIHKLKVLAWQKRTS